MERLSKQKSRPSVESLEGRMLLNGSGKPSVHVLASSGPRQFLYGTADGARVQVQLTGPGNLAGTSAPGGVLNLVFSGTNTSSNIVAKVTGGSGHAPLASVRNANVPLNSLTGLGGELINSVKLPQFDLLSGGNINLLAGVNKLTLNSMASNSQIHLRDTPLNTTSVSTALSSINNNNNGVNSGQTSTGTVTTSNLALRGAGTLEPVATGFGGSNVGALNGAVPIPGIGNGQNYSGTPGLNQAAVSSGRSLTYATGVNGGVTLASISGTFLPGVNLIEPRDASIPGSPVPPPGVIVSINHINGGPTATTPPLGNAQIYGYDATANTLIRFDAVTGVPTQTILVPPSTNGVGGVSLARNGGALVVLVGQGSVVQAFDTLSGDPAGQFNVGSLSGTGFKTVTGIGTGGQVSVLVDGTSGLIVPIDVTQSLATGQAVPTGSAFAPARDFGLAGTITGVPGTGNLYALGSAYFDAFQPNTKLTGVLTVNPGSSTAPKLAESARTALTSLGSFVPAGVSNGISTSTSRAIGSLDSFLAIDTGVVNGKNVIRLVTPSGLSSQGSITLNDPNPLTDLSQSYHPELNTTALVDVQGNVQIFSAKTATGLVLNDAGNLNQLSINSASNTSVIGLPFSHVFIPNRGPNVVITSSSRLTIQGRGGVVVNPALKQVGPLFLS